MAYDQSRNPQGEKQNKQSLAKIQHSKAHHEGGAAEKENNAPLVADPRNRLADGKTDPVTKELKPKRT